jgi:hypothetical protein
VALALNIIIAIFVVGSLGLVSYEMSRILLAREQLKHCLELASLAGGASMASTSQTGTNAQTQATTIALNILKMNSVLGTSLNGNVIVASSASALNPSPGQTAVYFEFDDPITKAPPVAGGQGNVLRVYGAYAYPLFSGGFGSIGVNTYTLLAEAMAGMPALDLVIVYNPSGSMDDQTNVTLVRRHWDQVTNNNIIYTIPAPGPGGGADGPLTGVVCPGILGSQVNGLPPQNLDAAGDPRTSTCVKEPERSWRRTSRRPPLRWCGTGRPHPRTRLWIAARCRQCHCLTSSLGPCWPFMERQCFSHNVRSTDTGGPSALHRSRYYRLRNHQSLHGQQSHFY